MYPSNLALLQQFFNDSQLKQVLADTSFHTSINFKVPEFYKHKMSEILADDTKYSLNLKKMAKRAKKDKVIFANLAECLVEGEVDINDDSWPKKQDIISITALILSSINIVAITWIKYKVRILCAALLLSKEIPRVNGLNLQYTMSPTTSSPSWTTVLSETLRWEHALFILSVLSLIGTTLLLCKKFKEGPKNTRICIEITIGLQCVIVEVLSLPLCPSYFNIRYPSAITDLKISGVFQPILSINWPNFQVINIMTEHKIIVPYKISISIMTAVRLRKILKESFCANIVILHHNYQKSDSDGSKFEYSLRPT